MKKFTKMAAAGAIAGTLLFSPGRNDYAQGDRQANEFYSMKPMVITNNTIELMKRGIDIGSISNPVFSYDKYAGRLHEFEKRIAQAKKKYCKQELGNGLDYRTAFFTYKYFDEKKADSKAKELRKAGAINSNEAKMFVKICQFWPMIKYYSMHATTGGRQIDPRIAGITIFSESRYDPDSKSLNKEGNYDVGLGQINSGHAQEFKEYYGKDRNPYWINGKDYDYSPNNLLLGINIIRDCCLRAGVEGRLEDANPYDLLVAYNIYTTGRPNFRDTAERHLNFVISFNRFLQLVSYVEKTTSEGNLIDQRRLRKHSFEDNIKELANYSRSASHLINCLARGIEPDTKKYPLIKTDPEGNRYIDHSVNGKYSQIEGKVRAMKVLNPIKLRFEGNEKNGESFVIKGAGKDIIVTVAGHKMYAGKIDYVAQLPPDQAQALEPVKQE